MRTEADFSGYITCSVDACASKSEREMAVYPRGWMIVFHDTGAGSFWVCPDHAILVYQAVGMMGGEDDE